MCSYLKKYYGLSTNEYLKWKRSSNFALETADILNGSSRHLKRQSAMIHLTNRCHHLIT